MSPFRTAQAGKLPTVVLSQIHVVWSHGVALLHVTCYVKASPLPSPPPR